ncbi:hypothetical protein ACIPUC_21345 [Streptomyces sp. LARHCF249]
MPQLEIEFPAIAQNWLAVESVPQIGRDAAEERAWIPAYWATPAAA